MKITSNLAAVFLAMCISATANADTVGMTWTAGGYTATSSDSGDVPPSAQSGTVASVITPTSLTATMTTNSNNAELGALFLDGNFTGGSLLSQTLRLQYDITVNNQPAAATSQPKNLDLSLLGGSSIGTTGILLGMNVASSVPGPASPWGVRFALGVTGANDGVFAMRSLDNQTLVAFGTYDVGTTYSLTLDANYTTGLMDAFINGNLALSGYQFADGGAAVTTSEVFIHLNGENGSANSVTIGNLSASNSVPDGGSSLTLLGGAIALLALSRRFRKL
ncbi:MAG: VPDSG-CTERM sorting domain-containing protein [Lacunisphaera sp.]